MTVTAMRILSLVLCEAKPMPVLTADKGIPAQIQSQKHPSKREFVFIYAFLSV